MSLDTADEELGAIALSASNDHGVIGQTGPQKPDNSKLRAALKELGFSSMAAWDRAKKDVDIWRDGDFVELTASLNLGPKEGSISADRCVRILWTDAVEDPALFGRAIRAALSLSEGYDPRKARDYLRTRA